MTHILWPGQKESCMAVLSLSQQCHFSFFLTHQDFSMVSFSSSSRPSCSPQTKKLPEHHHWFVRKPPECLIMPGDVSWWWSCHTGPPPSADAWISNVSLVKISILRRSTWKSAWCSCPATQSSASRRSFPLPGIVLVTSIAQLCHLCCVWTTLSPITASLTSRQEVVVEPALKKGLRWPTVEMAFEPGQWQCWSSRPPRHQLRDLLPPPNWWKCQTRFPPLFYLSGFHPEGHVHLASWKKRAFQELNLRAKGSHPSWPQSEGWCWIPRETNEVAILAPETEPHSSACSEQKGLF